MRKIDAIHMDRIDNGWVVSFIYTKGKTKPLFCTTAERCIERIQKELDLCGSSVDDSTTPTEE